jgi:hypothetical protein
MLETEAQRGPIERREIDNELDAFTEYWQANGADTNLMERVAKKIRGHDEESARKEISGLDKLLTDVASDDEENINEALTNYLKRKSEETGMEEEADNDEYDTSEEGL